MEEDHLGKPPAEWEIVNIGKTVIDRTAEISRDLKEFHSLRQSTIPSNSDSLYDHSKYIHELGSQILKVQKPKSDYTGNRADDLRRPKLPTKIYRKRVTVDEVERNSKMIAMDLDWDTSTWTQEEIESGCETLITIFQKGDATEAYEDQALKMLDKLMQRHKSAVSFMRKNIETLLSKTISRRVNNGKSGGILPLLNILNICTSRFAKELSMSNSVGRLFEMLLLENRLAVTLIQHCYRVYRKRQCPRSVGKFDEGFGTSKEVERQVQRALNARSTELRERWRNMHSYKAKSSLRDNRMSNGSNDVPRSVEKLFCERGPIYLEGKYIRLVLRIIHDLVSDSAGEYATANREDAVAAHAPLLLSLFVHPSKGPYCDLSMRILRSLCKIPESMPSVLQTGCVAALLRYFKALEPFCDSGAARGSAPDKEAAVTSRQDILLSLRELAEHAAGFFRANGGYRFIRAAESSSEEINYKTLLASTINHRQVLVILKNTLVDKHVLIELVRVLVRSTHVQTVSNVLLCLFALSCSECYTAVLEEVLALGGKGLVRIVGLLEEDDVAVSMPALYVLLQLCTREDCRGGMRTAELPKMLKSIIRTHVGGANPNYGHPSYLRALLALTAMCRRGEWRAYDPVELPKTLNQKKNVINAVYFDLMTIVKSPPVTEDPPDLTVMLTMRTDVEASAYLSKIANEVGSAEFCEFLARSDDPRHFHSLPWVTAASGCAVIEAIVCSPSAALQVLSVGTVSYLGQCIYFSFLELCEQSLSEDRTTQMLFALISAGNALSKLCEASSATASALTKVKTGVNQTHCIQAANFFAMTLATIHPALERYPALKRLQEDMGIVALGLLDAYCMMLLKHGDLDEIVRASSFIGKDAAEVRS